MKEIPSQMEALTFTIESVLWRAKAKPNPRQDGLQLLVTALAQVSLPRSVIKHR